MEKDTTYKKPYIGARDKTINGLDGKEYLTTAQVCSMYNTSKPSVIKFAKQGLLHPFSNITQLQQTYYLKEECEILFRTFTPVLISTLE